MSIGQPSWNIDSEGRMHLVVKYNEDSSGVGGTPQKRPLATPQSKAPRIVCSSQRSPLGQSHEENSSDTARYSAEDCAGTPLVSLIKQRACTSAIAESSHTPSRKSNTGSDPLKERMGHEAGCWGEATTEADRRAMFLSFRASFDGQSAESTSICGDRTMPRRPSSAAAVVTSLCSE